MRIPLFKPNFGKEEEEALIKVIRSGWIAQGIQVKLFEEKIAEHIRIEHDRVVALSSGTAALHLALICAGISAGDEVLVPSMGFVATAEAVVYCNAVPVFVDVDKWLHTSDVKDFENKLTNKTRAIMPVHVYGRMAPMDKLTDWARDKGLIVIEDSAPAFGAELSGKPAGLWGNYGCYSLQSSKPLTAGDGGILITPNKEKGDEARCLRFQGANVWDFTEVDFTGFWEEDFIKLGYSYRMTDLQAAVGLVQLKRYSEITSKKVDLFNQYNKLLSSATDKIFLPPEDINNWPSTNALQQYIVVIKDGGKEKRDGIVKEARKKGVFLMNGGYCLPSHSIWKNYSFDINDDQFPSAIFARDSTLSLPLYVGLKQTEIKEVCDLLLEMV